MKFREMLKLYKDGTLDAPQKELVETEIEKHEAISDYLYEASEIPELEDVVIPENAQEDKEAEGFAKMVKSAIRRAFIKMGVVVGTVILAIVLTVIFVLPNLVSKFYYDPNEVVGYDAEYDEETTRMSLDLAVITELFHVNNQRDYVVAEDMGYGEYRITIPQLVSYDGNFNDVAGILERNKLALYDPNLFKLPAGNAYVHPMQAEEWGISDGPWGTKEEAFERLQYLEEDKMYTAYFSLEELMDYESFCEQVGDRGYWCAVDAPNSFQDFGFFQYSGGRYMAWDAKSYPYLRLLGMDDHDSYEVMETHFLSMLKYMRDNHEIAEMLGYSDYGSWEDREAWNFAIDYIEENGMQIYGFAVETDKATILELSENENVSYVYTTLVQ